jgi:hypothetical protein
LLVRSDMGLIRLLTGLYNLPKLQELVLAVATAKIMVLHIDIERQKIVCVRFVMCLLLAPGFQGFFFNATINSTNEANKAGGIRH